MVDDARYTRLSGLDQSFLHFETPNAYMHVALTAIFEAGSLGRKRGGIDFDRIRRHIGSRLHLIPRYRQRLHHVAPLGEPIWVDDHRFDVERHVRHCHLPVPGSQAQLKTLVARLLERALDRARPLWEMWFIEGLSGGRFAMLIKVHHCLVDGIAGMDLLAALLDPAPVQRIPAAKPWKPAPLPSGSRVLRDAIGRRAGASLALLRRVSELGTAGAGREVGARLTSFWGLVRTGLERVSETPFNRPIGPHRRVEWVHFDLAQVKEVKRRLGGTVNDVVLGVVTGGIRRMLQRSRSAVAGPFRVLAPVSVRSQAERGQTGNRVSAWIAALPLDEPRVAAGYRRICAITSSLRQNQEEKATSLLVETAEWTPPLALAMSVRLLRQARFFNLIVTNIPGPDFQLHLLDAPMIAAHPHVPLFDNQGLGIALLSYAGGLSLGLVADWDLVPDLAQVADAMEAAFADLREVAGVARPDANATPPAATPAPVEQHAS